MIKHRCTSTLIVVYLLSAMIIPFALATQPTVYSLSIDFSGNVKLGDQRLLLTVHMSGDAIIRVGTSTITLGIDSGQLRLGGESLLILGGPGSINPRSGALSLRIQTGPSSTGQSYILSITGTLPASTLRDLSLSTNIPINFQVVRLSMASSQILPNYNPAQTSFPIVNAQGRLIISPF